MIRAFWVGGVVHDPPKWFHVNCLIQEACYQRDKQVGTIVSYPH